MRIGKHRIQAKALGAICSAGMMFQFSGCDVGQITTTSTVDARGAIIQLVRGAIVTPIETYVNAQLSAFDAFVTDRVNNLFN